MKEFIEQVHEFQNGSVTIERWSQALALTPPMLNPGSFTVDEVTAAIQLRDDKIRDELVAFVRGQKIRADVV